MTPIIAQLGVDPVHLGVMIVVTLEVDLITSSCSLILAGKVPGSEQRGDMF